MAFVESSLCYLAVPHGNGFDSVRAVVADALSEFGVEALDPSGLPAGSPLGSAIADMIGQADFVIADVTGSSPNVLWELGMAYGLRKPGLIMAQEQVSLPGDLALQQLLIYKLDEMPKLREYLRYWIRDVLDLQSSRQSPRIAAH